jgi:hypothetical protein
MNDPGKNFAMGKSMPTAPNYRLVCINESGIDQYVYIYQRLNAQPYEIYSLVWLASPVKLRNGARMAFSWTNEFSFVYNNLPFLSQGIICYTENGVPCSLNDDNYTVFDIENNRPYFSASIKDEEIHDLAIKVSPRIQKNKYSIGVSRSGSALFMQQALPDSTAIYNLLPSFWIAAADRISQGEVISNYYSQGRNFSFPPNVHIMYATLQRSKEWNVAEAP